MALFTASWILLSALSLQKLFFVDAHAQSIDSDRYFHDYGPPFGGGPIPVPVPVTGFPGPPMSLLPPPLPVPIKVPPFLPPPLPIPIKVPIFLPPKPVVRPPPFPIELPLPPPYPLPIGADCGYGCPGCGC